MSHATIVAPEAFKAAFESVLRRRRNDLSGYWYPWRAKLYTALFLQDESCILRATAKRLGLEYTSQWWTLDGIFYDDVDDIHFPANWKMAKHLSVAIEHENSSRRAPYQINKLSIFNAPLKVLITYPGGPGNRDEIMTLDLLSKCARVMQGADALRDFSEKRRQMIILGTDENRTKSGAAILKWRYFVTGTLNSRR